MWNHSSIQWNACTLIRIGLKYPKLFLSCSSGKSLFTHQIILSVNIETLVHLRVETLFGEKQHFVTCRKLCSTFRFSGWGWWESKSSLRSNNVWVTWTGHYLLRWVIKENISLWSECQCVSASHRTATEAMRQKICRTPRGCELSTRGSGPTFSAGAATGSVSGAGLCQWTASLLHSLPGPSCGSWSGPTLASSNLNDTGPSSRELPAQTVIVRMPG